MNRVWYTPTENTNSPDAIHQILMFGKLSEIQTLKKTLGSSKIREIFLRYPKKVYTAASLNFVKNFILRLSVPLDEQQYLKYAPRVTR
jgi:hypothetical protein